MLLSVAAIAAFGGTAYADHPIAAPKIYQHKVETALIWVEPVTMAPMPTMKKNFKPTIHNEIDQHAIKGDKMGFGAGGWIPDCEIACTISKEHSDWRIVFYDEYGS